MFHWLVHLSGPFAVETTFTSARSEAELVLSWLLKVKNQEHLKLSFLSALSYFWASKGSCVWFPACCDCCCGTMAVSFFLFFGERGRKSGHMVQNPIRVCVCVCTRGCGWSLCLENWSNWTERKEGCCCASLNPSSSWNGSILFLKRPWTRLWINLCTGQHEALRVSIRGHRWPVVTCPVGDVFKKSKI